jgi:hypothetical protein
MKRVITLLFALMLGMALQAQTFVGNMSIATFQQKNITCTLKVDAQGRGTLVIQRVKFAKMMPVRVDMSIADLTVKKDRDGNLTLTGTDIVPTAGEKSYPKKTVTNFHGTLRGGTLTANFTMSEKKVTFTGKQKK